MRLRRGGRAFEIETRGVEQVPESDRPLTPRGLAMLWAGASFNIEYLVWGALVVSLGLSLVQAVVVIVVGNLSWVATGLASVQGPATGTTSFGVSRAVFGPTPNRVLAGMNWLTQVGFETLGLVLVVLGGLALETETGCHPGTATKIAFAVTAAAIQGVVPWLGHATLTAVLRACTWIFGVTFVVLGILVAPKVHLHAGWHGANLATLSVAMVVVLASGGLGWTENANDYSRYLPSDTPHRKIVSAVALGGAVPVIVAELLGAVIATIVRDPGAISAISGVPSLFPGWFVVPYLIVVIAQLFAINGLDLYSSGVSLQATGVPLRRTQCVGVDVVICAGLTIWAVLSSSLTTALDDFAQLIIIWIAPWLAIYLVDGWLRRGRYDRDSLAWDEGGTCRRRSGTNRHALIAQVVGMIAAVSWIDTGIFVGPLSRWTGGLDLSIYLGAAVAGVSYWGTGRGEVRSESVGSDRPKVGNAARGV